MKLLYFTDSYPYGYGEQWKTNELKELVKVFDTIEVIPFHYGKNKQPVDPIAEVIYHAPLFDESFLKPAFKKLKCIIGSPYRVTFFKEMVTHVGLDSIKFRQWISNSYRIFRLLNHPLIQSRLLESTTPTIAYCFWGRNTAEVMPFVKNQHIKFVVRLHGYDLYHHRLSTGYLPYQKALLTACDLVLCISKHGYDYLSQKYRNIKGKLLLSRLGTLGIPQAKRSQDGILRIISCSSLIPLKRTQIIAHALEYISDRKVIWTHIGDGTEMKSIKEVVARLPSNIEVNLPGWVNSKDVTTYYSDKCVDLFINVSETEGVPVSIMEAMAAGIPSMATNVGGVSEIVDNSNGVLLNPDITAEELANQIRDFGRLNDDEIASMRTSALATFSGEYEARSNAQKLSQTLIQLMK